MQQAPRYNVVTSDRARQMLGAHIRFLAHADTNAARKTKAEILNAIRSLAFLPGRFPFLEAEHIPSNKYHKMVVENRYLILYQVKDLIVYVDYILDCRQDYTWLIK